MIRTLSLLALVLAGCTDKGPDTGNDNGGTGGENGANGGETGDVNQPPVVSAVTLDPSGATASSTLTATVTASDPDGDALTTRYQWYVDESPVGTDASSLAGMFTKGQSIRVEVWVSDAEHEVGPVASDALVIADTPPTAPAAGIDEQLEWSGAPGLLCGVRTIASDPDGDALSYRFAWTVDGVAFENAGTEDAPGDYVRAEDAARGKEWVCTITAYDGDQEGPGGNATNTQSGPAQGQYAFEEVMDDFLVPSDMLELPDGTFLIASLIGDVTRVDPTTGTILGQATLMTPDQELIAIALDPRFGDGVHDWIFGWASNSGELMRWDFAYDPLTATNPATLLTVNVGTTDGHCGGGLQFWDKETGQATLYLGVGPAIDASGQDTSVLGKQLLALNVSDTGAISPAFNAWPEQPMLAAIGLRNPWRVTDCGEVLCVADPGDARYEEIDLYSHNGMNFGFNEVEGPSGGAYDDPTLWWGDDDQDVLDADLDGSAHRMFSNVPVMSARLSGRGYGGRLEDWILYGDFFDGWVRGARIEDDGTSDGANIPLFHAQYIMKMMESADGTIWILDLGGSLRKLIFRADQARVAAVGAPLSETAWGDGVPYEPRYKLWSNGADKERVVVLPEGATIDTSDPAHFVWPDDTHIYKTFAMGGQNVETREMWKRDGSWVYGTYIWDGTDAYLSDGYRQTLTLDDGSEYILPSTALCGECHGTDRDAEETLGLSDFLLGPDGVAQLEPLMSDPIATIPEAGGDAATKSVRGYLQANCAFCHNPSGIVSMVSPIVFDLSYDSLIDTSVVAQYYHASPNLENGRPIFNTTRAADSVLVDVMENGDMPPAGGWEPDDAAIRDIEAWISGLP